jgi:cytochrome c oxidase subunit 3
MQKHAFHLVDPSPWPIFASLSLFGLTTSLVGYFNEFQYATLLAILSLISLIHVSVMWWRDVVRESTYQGHHTKRVQKGIVLGMILFIVSEIMLFFGFFWSFAHSSLSPTLEIGGIWPPRGIDILDPFAIPFLNTLILLTSGASITAAHFGILTGSLKETRGYLIMTIVLAAIFTSLQAFEYCTAPFTISDSVYGSCFYLLTGLHGVHVLVGTVFLLICLIRTGAQLRPDHHINFELAAIYWHFVDVVWLLVFLMVYYWGS